MKNIPLEAQEYVVNKKSALDWVVERACVSIDKASGIVNDFNDYAAEMGNERYPLVHNPEIFVREIQTLRTLVRHFHTGAILKSHTAVHIFSYENPEITYTEQEKY